MSPLRYPPPPGGGYRIRRTTIARKKDEAREIAKLCAKIADDKKAENVVVLQMTHLVVLTDYFVIANGTNPRQVSAIADELARTMRALKVPVLGVEGLQDGKWALLDCGDVVVHVFDSSTRSFYDLENLWADAPRVRWKKSVRKPAAGKGKTK